MAQLIRASDQNSEDPGLNPGLEHSTAQAEYSNVRLLKSFKIVTCCDALPYAIGPNTTSAFVLFI